LVIPPVTASLDRARARRQCFAPWTRAQQHRQLPDKTLQA
jgi:hypothetical protein